MKYILTIICVSLLLSSCKKGDTGAPGKDGNANVQTYVFTNQQWIYTPDTAMEISVPAITKDIFDKGAVEIYAKWPGDTGWTSVPNSYVYVVVHQGFIDIFPMAGWVSGVPIDVKVVVIASS